VSWWLRLGFGVYHNLTSGNLGLVFAGRCDAISNDSGPLASYCAADEANPDDYILLPEIISKAPNAFRLTEDG